MTKKTHNRKMQSESLSTVRVRLLLKADDVGLEPLFFHLQSLPTSVARSNFVRALLVAPVVIDRSLLDVLGQTHMNGEVDGTLQVELSISQRDAGLRDVLRELNAISGLSNRRLYLKRRLVFLFAVHGVSPSAVLLLQYAAAQAMRQGTMPSAITEAINPVRVPMEEIATNTSVMILQHQNIPIQAVLTKAPDHHMASPPVFKADDSIMNFSPIKTEGEEHTETQSIPSKGTKNQKFKENAGFFGNIKR